LEEEVNDKDSCGRQLKLELDELTNEKLDGYLDNPNKGDGECDLIDGLTRWINEQRCDCNGYMETKDKIKEVLTNNKKIKKLKPDCSDNKDADKKLKKIIKKVKVQIKETAEQFGSDKAQSNNGGEYNAPKDGELCEQDNRRALKLDQTSRNLDTDENGKEKKTSEPKKKDAPKRRLDTDENGKEKKTEEPKKKDPPKRRLHFERKLESVIVNDYEPYDLRGELSLEFEYVENSNIRNIVEGFGWHGFKAVDLKKEKLMKLSHNSLRYTCRRKLQMIEQPNVSKSSGALTKFWLLGLMVQ